VPPPPPFHGTSICHSVADHHITNAITEQSQGKRLSESDFACESPWAFQGFHCPQARGVFACSAIFHSDLRDVMLDGSTASSVFRVPFFGTAADIPAGSATGGYPSPASPSRRSAARGTMPAAASSCRNSSGPSRPKSSALALGGRQGLPAWRYGPSGTMAAKTVCWPRLLDCGPEGHRMTPRSRRIKRRKRRYAVSHRAAAGTVTPARSNAPGWGEARIAFVRCPSDRRQSFVVDHAMNTSASLASASLSRSSRPRRSMSS